MRFVATHTQLSRRQFASEELLRKHVEQSTLYKVTISIALPGFLLSRAAGAHLPFETPRAHCAAGLTIAAGVTGERGVRGPDHKERLRQKGGAGVARAGAPEKEPTAVGRSWQVRMRSLRLRSCRLARLSDAPRRAGSGRSSYPGAGAPSSHPGVRRPRLVCRRRASGETRS